MSKNGQDDADEHPSAEPCGQSWADMPGDDRKRFCGSCQHHVHNLSAMTAREAYALIKARRAGERLCVRYLVEDDQVVFREDEAAARQLSRQLDGLRRMAAVALVAVPLLTACEPVATSNEHAEAQAPLVIRDGQPVMLSPGAAAPPAAPKLLTPEEQELERWRDGLRAKQAEQERWRDGLRAKQRERELQQDLLSAVFGAKLQLHQAAAAATEEVSPVKKRSRDYMGIMVVTSQ